MRRKQSAQLLLLAALVVTIGGVALSSSASGARTAPGQKANKAVKALVRPALIRAEIVTFRGGEVGDYRIYRGVIRKLRKRQLTLIERDGAVVRVRLSAATQIRIGSRKRAAKRIRRGMHATLMRRGNAAASWLYVARGLIDKSGPRIKSLLSAGFVRAEVVSWAGGTVLDSRADTGVIESADDASLTLLERDGTTVQMQVDSSTQVRINNKTSITTDLRSGMKTTTIGDGEGTASQIWAYGKKSGVGRR